MRSSSLRHALFGATVFCGVPLLGSCEPPVATAPEAEPKRSDTPSSVPTAQTPACSTLDWDALRQRMLAVAPPPGSPADGRPPLPAGSLEIIPTAFISGGSIFRVIGAGPSGPIKDVIGCVDQGAAWRLGASEQAFRDFLAAVKLDLSTRELRLAYFSLFQETMHHAEVLDAFAALESRLSAASKNNVIAGLKKRYARTITRPKLTGEPPWRGIAYTLRHDRLVRVHFSLSPDGRIEEIEQLLEKQLPVPGRI